MEMGIATDVLCYPSDCRLLLQCPAQAEQADERAKG